MIDTLVFALLLALLCGLLLAAFAPAELAAIRRWRLRRRVRRYAAAYYRAGVDLAFAYQQLRGIRPDRRIRTLPRHRLAGGGR